MVELLRHRQTKEAATDMFSLQPPRHISTLPIAMHRGSMADGRFRSEADIDRFWRALHLLRMTLAV
jgi:hypothetical protein